MKFDFISLLSLLLSLLQRAPLTATRGTDLAPSPLPAGSSGTRESTSGTRRMVLDVCTRGKTGTREAGLLTSRVDMAPIHTVMATSTQGTSQRGS